MRGSEKEKNLIDKYVGRINYLSQELEKIMVGERLCLRILQRVFLMKLNTSL